MAMLKAVRNFEMASSHTDSSIYCQYRSEQVILDMKYKTWLSCYFFDVHPTPTHSLILLRISTIIEA